MMLLYSQRDSRWRGVEVGKSSRTLGQIGCLVTSIAMISTYFKPSLTPLDILKQSGFTADGRLIWAKLKTLGFSFYYRQYWRDDARIKQHLSHPDLAVVFEVANHSHWVVGIGYNPILRSYRIADPLFGDKTTMRRYQDNITGAAFFKRV